MRWLPAVPLHPAHPPAVRIAAPLAAFQDDTDYYALRFEGTGRLYGQGALANLAGSRVCVVGLGGVGSWAVEALARAGVGSLTLMDPDEVCISNTNRQTNALQGTVGRSKARVLAERVAQINPECRVRVREEWFTLEEGHDVLAAEAADATAERAGGAGSFAVLDAIDSYVEKCAAVEACIRLGVHVAVAGASGGRSDPSCVRVSDLTCTSRDPLLAAVRRSLRVEHGFPVGPRRMPPPWGVPAIYSIEEVDAPAPRAEDKAADGSWSNCEARFGTAGFVTGTFGLAAASVVTRLLATAAPLPEGRAAVAAALPPDRSIARPVAQRISERHAYRAAKAAAEP